jgi:hypothetical protein
MDFNMLRLFYRFQGVSDVSGLSAAFLATSFPQTLGRRSIVSIAGGWFTAVSTVFRDLVLQGLLSGYQHFNHFDQARHKRNDRFFSFANGGSNFFLGR